MGKKTITLPELGVEIPIEGYDVGFRGPGKSYPELNKTAFQAVDEKFATGLSEIAIHEALPGNVQATIDEAYAGGGGVVRLDPESQYNTSEEGGEIHIRRKVVVLAHGVDWIIDSPTNGFFLDNEAKLLGYPDIRVRGGVEYSGSAAILFDLSRSEHGAYGFGANEYDVAQVAANVRNGGQDGTGLLFNAPGGGISFLRVDVTIQRFNDGIRLDAPSGGFINGNRIRCALVNCTNHIHIISGECSNHVYGVMQAAADITQRTIWNEETSKKRQLTWRGHIWDTSRVVRSAVEGPNITVITDNENAYGITRDTDPSLNNSGSVVYGFGRSYRVGWLDSGDMWETQVRGDGLHWVHYDDSMNSTEQAHISNSGGLDLEGGVIQNVSGPPRTTDYTASNGEVVLADTSANNVTVTLPAPGSGKFVRTINTDSSSSGDLFVETPGSATIDSTPTLTLAGKGGSADIYCDGSNWWSA